MHVVVEQGRLLCQAFDRRSVMARGEVVHGTARFFTSAVSDATHHTQGVSKMSSLDVRAITSEVAASVDVDATECRS